MYQHLRVSSQLSTGSPARKSEASSNASYLRRFLLRKGIVGTFVAASARGKQSLLGLREPTHRLFEPTADCGKLKRRSSAPLL